MLYCIQPGFRFLTFIPYKEFLLVLFWRLDQKRYKDKRKPAVCQVRSGVTPETSGLRALHDSPLIRTWILPMFVSYCNVQGNFRVSLKRSDHGCCEKYTVRTSRTQSLRYSTLSCNANKAGAQPGRGGRLESQTATLSAKPTFTTRRMVPKSRRPCNATSHQRSETPLDWLRST